MGMFFNEDINTLFVGGSAVSAAYVGSEQVWPIGLPSGTVFNFEYTGNVQSVELPRGKYKLQCWGAQGGNVTGTYAVNGSKGGYSEGVLTLTEKTTLYVFVGGQGASYTSSASQTSTSIVNGGWNGGGAGVRTSRYSSSSEDGRSFPRGGGGATDISTVTSAMSYSSGRTTRDNASLLARCIVAGGGAGASARYTSKETSSTSTSTLINSSYTTDTPPQGTTYWQGTSGVFNIVAGRKYKITCSATSGTLKRWYVADTSTWGSLGTSSFTASKNGTACVLFQINNVSGTVKITVKESYTTSSTSTSSGKSNTSMQGGGTSGKGQYPGTQSAAGNGGAFGLGATQSVTNYRYCGGGGGGGWYGGGTSQSDSSTSYVSYSGGGSGFVNTAANASSRPSGYTGLQLDSGTTTAGNTSFESVSGSTETGHSGNGYARITVLGNEGGGTGSLLPSGYTMCEYIESTGTQYINTGIMAKAGLRAIIDCKINDLNSTSNIFGAFDTKNRIYLHYEASIKLLFGYGAYNKVNYNLIAGERVVFDAEFNTGTQSLKVNGTQVYSGSNSSSVNTGLAAYLGAMNQGNAASLFTKMTIYSCKIYENEILVRDYIPALRSDGIAGLYDLVDGQFYYSLGSEHLIGKQQ